MAEDAIVEAIIRAKAENLEAFSQTGTSASTLKEHFANLTAATQANTAQMAQMTQGLGNVREKHEGATTSSKGFHEAMRQSSALMGESAGTAETLMGKFNAMSGLMGVGGGLAIGALAGTAAIGFLGESLKHGADDAVTLAEATHKLQLETGMTADSASGMISTFKILGVDSDRAETALFRLGKTVAESPEKFEAMGVAIARNSDGSVNLEKTLGNLSDAYRATGDATQRDQMLFEAFGRSGKDLAVVMDQGSAGLAKYREEAGRNGGVINQAQVDKAREYAIVTRQNQEAWEGFTRSIAMTAMPAMTTLEQATTRSISGQTSWQEKMVNSLGPIGWAAQATGMFNAKIDDQAKTAHGAAGELDRQTKAIGDLNKAQQSGLDAVNKDILLKQQAIQDDLRVTSAIQSVSNAQDAYNQAVARYGPESDQAKTAADRMKTTQNEVVSAMFASARTAMDLAVANDALAGGHMNAAEAGRVEIAKLKDLENQLDPNSPLRARLEDYIGQIERYINSLSRIPSEAFTQLHLQRDANDPNIDASANLPGFAAGGSFAAGQSITVGERGPERVTFPRGGFVTPNDALAPTVNVSVAVNVQTNADPDEIARQVSRAIAQSVSRHGTFLS